jgi:hypothetical protein
VNFFFFLYDVNIFKFFNEHTKKILGTAMVLNHRFLSLYLFSEICNVEMLTLVLSRGLNLYGLSIIT